MGFNAKLFEVVVYPESFDMQSLPGLLTGLSGLRHYAYIVHDQDEGKKEHCHIMLRMNTGHNSDNVAKWFNASPAQVERCKGRWADMLAYLTHGNASEKFQYEPEKVQSNFDWKTESEKSGNNGQRLSEIWEGIVSGQIRQYNITKHLKIDEYSRYKRQIKDAFEYRLKTLKTGDREMQTYYIWGDSGAGKTTFAKTIAVQLGYELYVSSGSNDVLDGYEGQECLILDDMRPSTLGLQDLLKLLDPHTGSSVKSRYYNKVLECKLIIITTTLPIDTFFKNVFTEETESLVQLQRRCTTKIHLTKETMKTYEYDPDCRCYKLLFDIPNPVLPSIVKKKQKPKETIAKFGKILSGLSGSITAEYLEENSPLFKKDDSIPDNVLKVFPGTTLQDPDLFPDKEKIPF